MPGTFRESCNRFCRENLCHIIIWMIAAGAAVAWFVYTSVLDMGGTLQETALMAKSTASSVDAHIAQERDSTQQIITTLEGIKIDLGVLKYRVGAPGGMSGNLAAFPSEPQP